MALGDVLYTKGLSAVKLPVKDSTAIARGDLLTEDSGWKPAVEADAVDQKVYVALEDSPDDNDDDIKALEEGYVEVKKKTGEGTVNVGAYLVVSDEAGKAGIFTKADLTDGNGGDPTSHADADAELHKLTKIIGYCIEEASDTDTTIKMRLY